MLTPRTLDGDVSFDRPLSEVKAELFRALGHAGRVRILEVLSDGDQTVGELAALVGLEPSHLSQQLGVLRRVGAVTVQRVGSTATYSLTSPEVRELLAVAKAFLLANLRARQELLGVEPAAQRTQA